MMNSNNGPLKGMKVVEYATFIAGPYGARILSELGADVIKIENPGPGGDAARTAGSPFINGQASFMQTLNAGKKCITLNTRTPEGLNLLYELLKDADVFIDNHPAGSSEKAGFGWEKLHEINPKLIVCRLTGFGMTETKYRDFPAYDPLFEGLAGYMSVTGEPGTPPTKSGTAIGDIAGGLWTAIACSSAYNYQQKTGKGQLIDYSLAAGMMTLMENLHATYMWSGKVPGKVGNAHPNIGPFNSFECKDGWAFIAAGTQGQANAVADIVGHPEWKEDPNYASNNLRVANRSWIEPEITKWCKDHTIDEVVMTMVKGGVAAGPIYNMQQAYDDGYFHQRKMFVKATHVAAGDVEILGSPLSFMSETPAEVKGCCGLLGGDNKEVFTNLLNLTEEQYQALVDADAFGIK